MASEFVSVGRPPVRWLTDDRDGPAGERAELTIFQGENGDWYVGVSAEGSWPMLTTVRICTSGGAASECPGLVDAIWRAYTALERVPGARR